jgi:hypothetical protein
MPANGEFAFHVRVGGGLIQLEEYHDVSKAAALLLQISCCMLCSLTLLNL